MRKRINARRPVSKIPRAVQLRTHHFKQTYHPSGNTMQVTGGTGAYYPTGSGAFPPGTLVSQATASIGPMFFTLDFRLDDLPQLSSYQTIFDSFRINKVVVKFRPLQSMVPTNATDGSGTNVSTTPPLLQTVIDYDDSNLLTSENQLLNYDNLKISQPWQMHKRVFVPAISANAFKAGGSTIGYYQKKKQWIDAAYPDTIHYGIKGYTPGPITLTATTQAAWVVYVTMFFSMKELR